MLKICDACKRQVGLDHSHWIIVNGKAIKC